MEWVRERQEEAINEYVEDAFKQSLFTFMANKETIKELTREQMLGCGFDTYGDSSFHISEEELMYSKLKEAANFVAFHIISIARSGE